MPRDEEPLIAEAQLTQPRAWTGRRSAATPGRRTRVVAHAAVSAGRARVLLATSRSSLAFTGTPAQKRASAAAPKSLDPASASSS
jgi:hypothetical protein